MIDMNTLIRLAAALAVASALAGCEGEDPSSDPPAVPAIDKEARLAAQGEGYLARAEEAASGDPSREDLERAAELYGKSIEAFERVPLHELPSGSLWRAYRARLDLLMRLRSYAEASKVADGAVSLAPTEADARWVQMEKLRARSELALAEDDFPAAIALLERAVEIEPEHRSAASRLESVRKTWYLLLKRKLAYAEDLPAAYAERLGETAPATDTHTAFFGVYDLARLALREDRPDEAFEDLKHGVESLRQLEAEVGTPTFREMGYHVLLGHFMNLTGVVLVELGRYDLAAKAFQTAIDVDEDNGPAAANAKVLGI